MLLLRNEDKETPDVDFEYLWQMFQDLGQRNSSTPSHREQEPRAREVLTEESKEPGSSRVKDLLIVCASCLSADRQGTEQQRPVCNQHRTTPYTPTSPPSRTAIMSWPQTSWKPFIVTRPLSLHLYKGHKLTHGRNWNDLLCFPGISSQTEGHIRKPYRKKTACGSIWTSVPYKPTTTNPSSHWTWPSKPEYTETAHVNRRPTFRVWHALGSHT